MSNTTIEKTQNRKMKGIVSFLSLVLIIFAARMVFVFNIGYFYIVFISSILIAGVLVCCSNQKTKSHILEIAAFAIFLWVVQSELIKYRHSPLVPYAPTGLASIFPGLLMGYVFVSVPINKKLLKITMYATLSLFFVVLVIIRDTSFMMNLSEKTSDVGVLNLTMALIIPVLYLEYRDERKVSLLPLMMQLVISLFLESRTGLGTCAMFAAMAVFVGIHSIKKKSRRYALYFLIGLVFIVSIFLIISNMSSFAGVSKSMDQGVDLTGRAFIWANYFENFSYHDLFFGRDIIGINEGEWQNAHNSWIQLHSLVGFVGIVIMIFYLRVLVGYIKSNLLFAGVMFIMIVFSFFNMVFFFTTFDWCVYIFFFDYLMRGTHLPIEETQLKLSLT